MLIAVSVVLDDREGDDKFAQAYVMKESIIAIREDLDNKNRCYVLMTGAHGMHVDMSVEDLKNILTSD